MHGMMMNRPLRIAEIIGFAEKMHPNEQIISKTLQGEIHTSNYAETAKRSRRMSKALLSLGIKMGDRVATLAWNSFRHFELYFAISGIGAICHTINPRLSSEQLTYVVNHASDSIIFIDLTFIPIIEAHIAKFPKTTRYVLMADREHMPQCNIPGVMCYEDLINKQDEDYIWPEFDENTASGLCYTSGTTGNPKGVLYSHRSTVLHSLLSCIYNSGSFAPSRKILPIVPLFHANAWGLPYAAPISGTALVFPGANLDGKSVYDLLNQYEVHAAWGVPTVWMGLLDEIKKRGSKPKGLSEMLVGGSAAAKSLIEEFENMGVSVIHAWGMTEMSPLGTSNSSGARRHQYDADSFAAMRTNVGQPIFGVEVKITDDDNNELPWDGVAFGALKVRGPWICSSYFKLEGSSAHAEEGWFETGDVATIDARGNVSITDRTKDVIKSGGEWISSIEVENCATGHPMVAEAAVIGRIHPKWGERPLLIVVKNGQGDVTPDELKTFLDGKIAKWWIPDDVQYIKEMPHTATGKIQKMKLREIFEDYQFPA